MQQYLQHTEDIKSNLILIRNINISNTETRERLINTLYDFFKYTNLYLPQVQYNKERFYIIQTILAISNIKIQENNQSLITRLKIIYIQINILFYIYYKNLFELDFITNNNIDEEIDDNNTSNQVIYEDIRANINDFFTKPQEEIHITMANHHAIYRNILHLLRNTEVPYYRQITDVLYDNMFN